MHNITMDKIPFLKKLRNIPGLKPFIWGQIVLASILLSVGMYYPSGYTILDKLAINLEKQTPSSVYQFHKVEFVFSGIKFPDDWKKDIYQVKEHSKYARQNVFNDIALYLEHIYPPGFLDDYIDTVFYPRAMTNNGKRVGGTRNIRTKQLDTTDFSTIVEEILVGKRHITMRQLYKMDFSTLVGGTFGTKQNIRVRQLYVTHLSTLVMEISRLLYNHHRFEFPIEWRKVWEHHYTNNGKDIVSKEGVLEYKPEFLKLGFVSEFAMANEANDFLMMYRNLYTDPETLFQHAEEHELLGRKLDLTISFLSKVMGENLDKEYFLARSLRQYRVTPSTITAALPVVEEALKAVLAAEHRNFEKHMLEDSEYFDRLRLLIMGVEMKFLKMGLGEEQTSKLIHGLKEYMKQLFVESCMKAFEERDDVFDGDDPEEVKRGYKDSFEALWEEADPSKPVK